ncbi:MAG TPA: copper resistance protein NlpE [Methylococcaceae bacterium]|nr:copper resistance protein NlpE [Methylococcaceae bacterium]
MNVSVKKVDAKKQLDVEYPLALILFAILFFFASMPSMAASDREMQESYLRSRASTLMQEGNLSIDHSNHGDKSQEYRGVYYGFLPCADCLGVKTTLSLKHNTNYLLVTQYTKESAREYFEKGKYDWNEETKTLVLTSNKDGSQRKYLIKDDNALIQVNSDGSQMKGAPADKYTLLRSDVAKSREVHIH